MPRSSKKLVESRKDEIIKACAQLYETKSFKDITLKDISLKTSFSRPSIYNYFHTKEEIFLALMEQEYESWVNDIEKIMMYDHLSNMQFADMIAKTLEKRECLLKLMSMNHYDMEANSRIENLISFKKAYGLAMTSISKCLFKFFPNMKKEDVHSFIYAFFPFLFGIYPYTFVSDKQKEALEKAKVDYIYLSVYEITYSFILKLLKEAI